MSWRWITWALSLLLLVGCGRQDRYQISAPQRDFIVESGPEMALEEIRHPLNGWVYGATYFEDTLHLLNIRGRVIQVHDGQFRLLPPVPETRARYWDILIGPEGKLWLIDQRMEMHLSWDGETWQEEPDPTDRAPMDGWLLDEQDRLLAWEKEDGIWRRDPDGTWSQIYHDESAEIVGAWVDPTGGPPAFLDAYYRIITFPADSPSLTAPFLEDPRADPHGFLGDGNGHWMIYSYLHRAVYLNDGDSWQEHIQTKEFDPLFLLDGHWIARALSEDTLYRWENDAWVPWREVPETPHHKIGEIYRPGEGWLLLYSYGETWFLDDTSFTQVTRNFGLPMGFAMVDGDPCYLTDRGWLFKRDGEIWTPRRVPDPDWRPGSSNKSLFAPPDGGLLLLGETSTYSWQEGAGFQLVAQAENPGEVYFLDDGRLAFHADNRLFLWEDLAWKDLGPTPDLGPNSFPNLALRDVDLAPDGRIWYCYRDRIMVRQEGSFRTVLTFQGWHCQGLVRAPGRGLFAYGAAHFLNVESPEVNGDITPWWDNSGNHGSTFIEAACHDGTGGIVALDSRGSAVLHWDGVDWWAVDRDDWGNLNEPNVLCLAPDGTLYAHEESRTLVLREVGQ